MASTLESKPEDSPAPPPSAAPRRKKAAPVPAPAVAGDQISGSIADHAQGAAIGKNIFQNIIVIGTLKIPVLPVLVLIVLVLGAAAFFGLRLLGPATMSGSFNLAVANFGQVDASGKVVSSAQGDLISQRLYQGLKIEFQSLTPAEQATFQPQVWQDSMDITQKRVPLGIIPGDTPGDRKTAACDLAQRIHARVVIYGNLPPETSQASFIPEFAICDDPSLRVDADEILGAHQVIQGLPVQLISQLGSLESDIAVNMRLNDWSNTLSLFSIGIMYDLQGYPLKALGVFTQALGQASGGVQPASEVLQFFIGREELTLAIPTVPTQPMGADQANYLVNAENAFTKAIAINPGYARAYIGLAGVYFDRAQAEAPAARLKGVNLGNALHAYQQALSLAPGSPGALIDTKARLGLASAWILQGEAQRDNAMAQAAADSFTQAAQAAQDALQPLIAENQYRVLAQAYLTLGEANHEQGNLALQQGNSAAALDSFKKASSAYAACIQQREAAPTDQTLAEKIVAGLCEPYKKSVDAALASLEK